MKLENWKIVPVLSVLALATIVTPYAHAGCGLYTPVQKDGNYQPQIAVPEPEQADAAIDGDDAGKYQPSIVGMWKEHLISEGSKGIPDGTEVDASYAQWHNDGTEMQVSGMRAPLTGDVCVGVYIKTGVRTYQLNHFGVSFDPTGQNLVGPARIQEWVTINAKGNATWGSRVTMETGFQKVE
jgi:hypothetical protein